MIRLMRLGLRHDSMDHYRKKEENGQGEKEDKSEVNKRGINMCCGLSTRIKTITQPWVATDLTY